MELEALKHLIATLALHATRERLAAPVHQARQLEDGWFGPLTQYEAATRKLSLGVDQHVRSVIERAEQLPEAPRGIPLVSALKKASFECSACTTPEAVCDSDQRRNATNLALAKRECVRYLTAHFEALSQIAEDMVGRYTSGMQLAPPRVRFVLRIASPADPAIHVVHCHDQGHAITLAIDPVRFTKRMFHAVTFELFRALLGPVWDGAALSGAEPSPPEEPFVAGWMTEIAYRGLETWLRREPTLIAASEERSRQALLQVERSVHDTELGLNVTDARLALEVARDLKKTWRHAGVPEDTASDALFRWSFWLLVVRPSGREKMYTVPLSKDEQVAIVGAFLNYRDTCKPMKIWAKLSSTFL